MTDDTQATRVLHGQRYEHEQYGEVEVVEIIDPIESIGPDGPSRNYFVHFKAPLDTGAVPSHHSESYEEFVEAVNDH